MSNISGTESLGRVVSAKYIERNTSKNELVRRLRNVVEALGDDDIEPNSPDYPGLASLAASLVEDRFLSHRDKEVRLYTVLACMEIFYLYAPDPPWYSAEILRVFSQMIRQLANLAHCTSRTQANFTNYFRLLEQLSEVKIGVILVELIRTLDSEKLESADDESPSCEEALEMLANLVRTILRSVHIDHPPEVANNAVAAISACIEEFDGTVPIPVLDEILSCVGEGPVVLVTNPAAVEAAAKAAKSKEKKPGKMPPMQIQQTNPSYTVAAAVIRRTVDRISTPIASLLNGILNGDANILAQTNISTAEHASAGASSAVFTSASEKGSSDVWAIVYELHRISSQILTTVIGTVTNSLQSANLELRLRVTKLLGRLFYSPASQIGVQFNPCFREWIRRSNDVEPKVRQAMVKYLVTVLSNKGQEELLAAEASTALVKMIEHDPNIDVRLQAIHQVCDLAYKAKDSKRKPPASGTSVVSAGKAWVSPRLLQAVGNRVSSKNKTERRDALTGLAQVYYRHYVLERVAHVQRGGEDCAIDVILEALHDAGVGSQHEQALDRKEKRRSLSNHDNDGSLDLDEKYGWIPRKVFESACFTDSTDPQMRNRVYQIVDDVLLGSSSTSSSLHKNENTSNDPLTPTSRAVGLAFIVDSICTDGEDSSNAYKWMCRLFSTRAALQRALSSYIDARAKIKKCEPDTEEAIAAEAEAMERLEVVASMTTPAVATGSGSSPGDVQPVLRKLHSARDKHIFRILATVSSPTHSANARARAFDELPKRTKSLGNDTAAWVKTLARRCAMGNFINSENINHCVLLAQECFQEGDMTGCMAFLSCVKVAASIFPSLCGTKEGFGTLVELFGECRAVGGAKKKEIEALGIMSALSAILAASAAARASPGDREKGQNSRSQTIDQDLQDQLLQLCTRDGTPYQAKNAVYTMAALLRTTGPKQRSVGSRQDVEAFGPLIKLLTSARRLILTNSGSSSMKLITTLTALAALAECAPALFQPSSRGNKAIKFAFDTVLLGRDDSLVTEGCENDNELSEEEDEEIHTPSSARSKRRQSSGRKGEVETFHSSPSGKIDLLEDESLSIPCRRLCAAIDLLVVHIRSTIVSSSTGIRGDVDDEAFVSPPKPEHIQQVFTVLSQIVRDGGLPPSSRDRRHCRSRQDRAALRQCAATSILRLSDGRLKLEKLYLTSGMWHVLGNVFLDEERVVREAAMEQLCSLMRGTFAPSLRFLSFVVLCVDGEHSGGHAVANANAANVGKRSVATKTAALHCISGLRKSCEALLAQCRSRGREAEKKFESQYRMMLMPEFSVPYALHLLSFRRETPSAGGTTLAATTERGKTQEEEEDWESDDQGGHRILKKRFKWLFEPLIGSLGDSADNISFLLRMTEMMGNHYQPKVVSMDFNVVASLETVSRTSSPSDPPSPVTNSSPLATAKFKTVCATAREVLLSLVKKDVNLTPFPGAVQVPSALFKRLTSSTAKLSQSTNASDAVSFGSSISATASNAQVGIGKHSDVSVDKSVDSQESRGRGSEPRAKRRSRGRKSSESGHVHFSPAVSRREFYAPDDDDSDGVAGSPGRQDPEKKSPGLSTPSNSQSLDGFGALSPIDTSASPAPSLQIKQRAAASTSSEKQTLGSTPPSILRSREPGPTLSAFSDSDNDESVSASVSGAKRSSRSRSVTEKGTSSQSVGKHRESPKRALSQNANRTNKKQRKNVRVIQVNVGASESVKRNQTESQSKVDKENDEFEFPGDEKRNDEIARSSSARGRWKKGAKDIEGYNRPPQEISLGSNSSQDDSESSSITRLKRGLGEGAERKRRKQSKTGTRRSRRNRG